MVRKFGIRRVLREVRLGNAYQHGLVWNGARGCFERTYPDRVHSPNIVAITALARSLEYAAVARKMGDKSHARQWVTLARSFNAMVANTKYAVNSVLVMRHA